MPNIKILLLPLLVLACNLFTPTIPPPRNERVAMAAQVVKPAERIASPAPSVCQVKTGIDAGALNLRACGAMTCPVVIVLHEGETLTQTGPGPVDGWLAVGTQAGLSGWVNSKYLTCEVKNE